MKFLTLCLVTAGLAGGVRGVRAEDTAPLRLLRCPTTSAAAVTPWQRTTRTTLFALLNIDDLVAADRHDDVGRGALPLHPKVIDQQPGARFARYLIEIDSRPDRRIQVVVTVPNGARPHATPAVVCIHGHGGTRDVVYDRTTIYHGFATTLAENGYVTLSANVGQHTVQDKNRTLMGERLWDLIRVVDLAVSREEVDSTRIGCAGLSLGGEMAMWLGAMDPRIQVTVSAGFLTLMENLRVGHCMCWDFPGLQRRYEFIDIYSLIAPRPLQCQNGRKERLPGGFPVDLAERAMTEIQQVYRVLGHADAARLAVHDAGHVFDVGLGKPFLDAVLQP